MTRTTCYSTHVLLLCITALPLHVITAIKPSGVRSIELASQEEQQQHHPQLSAVVQAASPVDRGSASLQNKSVQERELHPVQVPPAPHLKQLLADPLELKADLKNTASAHAEHATRTNATLVTQAQNGGAGTLALLVIIAAIVCLVALGAAFIFIRGWHHHTADDGKAKGKQRSSSSRSPPRSNQGSSAPKFSPQPSLSSDQQLSAPTSVSGSSGEDGLYPVAHCNSTALCPLLVVPVGTRLACVVQNVACRKKQELTFDIRGLLSRGGQPLFQIILSEVHSDYPVIRVETVQERGHGRERLAYCTTQELFQRDIPDPRITLYRGSDASYGRLQRLENGDYGIIFQDKCLLRFTGNFQQHDVHVIDAGGATVATVSQMSADEYQVYVSARTDAGLVILGLVGIDKFEIAPDYTAI